MAAQEYRVSEVNEIADKLILDGHSERETIAKRKEVSEYTYLEIFSRLASDY